MIQTLRRILTMLILAFVAVFSLQSRADSSSPATIYPGWKAVASNNWSDTTPDIQNWRRMLTRWSDGKTCESESCTTKGWAEMVAKVKAAGDPLAELTLANSLINNPLHNPYIEDINNWKQHEYWETPYEFLKKSGDAEDFAIAKYFLLKAAGVPVADMQILAVRLKSQGNVGHMILATRVGKTRTVILDNRVGQVLDLEILKEEFTPVLGINEKDWCIYVGR